MTTGNTGNALPVARVITHKVRDNTSDVNSLLQSSSEMILSADDNFIVGRQKAGQLHNLTPGFKLPFKEKYFNAIEKYYEVDKRRYPFIVTFDDMPSLQATFKFRVKLEFTLQVTDPCMIVKENLTSLLDCVRMDLKNTIYSVSSGFLVQRTGEARMALHTALTSFQSPSFLKITMGVVDIMPDEAATKMLRELEQKNLDVALISKKTTIDSANALSTKITDTVANDIEEHMIQKQIPNLLGSVLNNDQAS
jgi:hypothetical protein